MDENLLFHMAISWAILDLAIHLLLPLLLMDLIAFYDYEVLMVLLELFENLQMLLNLLGDKVNSPSNVPSSSSR